MLFGNISCNCLYLSKNQVHPEVQSSPPPYMSASFLKRGPQSFRQSQSCSPPLLEELRELKDPAVEPLPSQSKTKRESYGGAVGSLSAALRPYSLEKQRKNEERVITGKSPGRSSWSHGIKCLFVGFYLQTTTFSIIMFQSQTKTNLCLAFANKDPHDVQLSKAQTCNGRRWIGESVYQMAKMNGQQLES